MRIEIRRLSQSFKFAYRGITQCAKTERNFRIHICATIYVTIFATIAKLSVEKLAILALCFAIMMSAELMNTAIERLCDRDPRGYNGMIRDAKDIAAAGVFICALFCIVIAGLFFLQPQTIHQICTFLQNNLWLLGILVLSVPFAIAFAFNWRGKI